MSCLLSHLLPVGLTIVLAPAPKGHQTPQACFRAYMAADAKKDFKASVACLTDEVVAVRNAYLIYLAAFNIKYHHDVDGEELRMLKRHHVSTQTLDDWIDPVNDMQTAFNRSKRTAKDWKKYDATAKMLSATLKDQRAFAVDANTVIFRNRPVSKTVEFKITRERRSGRYAELVVEIESGPNHFVSVVWCEWGNEGWKMMTLSRLTKHAPPFPPE